MDKTKDKERREENLQWHPAFFATAQIELQEEGISFQFRLSWEANCLRRKICGCAV